MSEFVRENAKNWLFLGLRKNIWCHNNVHCIQSMSISVRIVCTCASLLYTLVISAVGDLGFDTCATLSL